MKTKLKNYLQKFQLLLASLALISPLAFRIAQPILAKAVDDGLVGYWKFDENGVSTAADSSGYGNTGTLHNGASTNDTQLAPTNFPNDFSLVMDGVDNYVSVPDDPTLNFETSMTAMAWVYWGGSNAEEDDNVVFDKSTDDTPNYRLLVKDDGHLAFWNGTTGALSSGTIQSGEWSLINFTIEDGVTSFYINGSLSGQTAIGLGPTTSSDLLIGRDNFGRYFNGYIDEARLYSRALTPAEAADIASGNAGPVNEPVTTILSDPGSFSHDPTAEFEFDSDVQPSTFKCSVDDALYTVCTSPFTTPELTDGSHSFAVKAIDANNIEDSTPATHTWTVQSGDDPFNISTCEELQAIENNLDADYQLTGNIDCGGTLGATAFRDDFEGDTSGWSTDGDNNTWQVTDETCQLEENVYSPVTLDSKAYGSYGSAGSDCALDYEEDSTLTSPTISVPDSADAKLRFTSIASDEAGSCDQSGNEEDDNDYDNKSVYVISGETRTLLNDCYALNSDNEAVENRRWVYSLADFAGQDIQLEFHYQTVDDCCESELGWFIDDVQVYESSMTLFHPIGSFDNPFTGTLNGQDYSITRVNINESMDGTGLFGSLSEDALVKNVTLGGFYVSNSDYNTGILAGYNAGTIREVTTGENELVGGEGYTGGLVAQNTGTILNCDVNTLINADDSVGGIAGINDEEGQIYASVTSGTIHTNDFSGGVTAENDSLIFAVYSGNTVDGNIIEADSIGGISGYNGTEATISNSYSSGDVTGEISIGGIVGYNEGTVERTYSSGDVSGAEDVGGIAGTNIAYVNYSFSVSPTIGEESVGGVIGTLDGSEQILAANYYDIYRTGLDVCVGDGSYPDGEGCDGLNELNDNADYFKNSSSPALANWDFANIWGLSQYLNDGFPCLQQQSNCTGTPDPEDPSDSADLVAATDGSAIKLEETGCASISSSSAVKESSLSVQDSAYDYPVGFTNFSLSDCETGGTATINLTFTGDYDLNKIVIRKYNSTSHTYTTLTSANSGLSLSKTTLNAKTAVLVSYHIVDGGVFDQDGSANGSIVDPVGVAASIVAAPDTGFGGSNE